MYCKIHTYLVLALLIVAGRPETRKLTHGDRVYLRVEASKMYVRVSPHTHMLIADSLFPYSHGSLFHLYKLPGSEHISSNTDASDSWNIKSSSSHYVSRENIIHSENKSNHSSPLLNIKAVRLTENSPLNDLGFEFVRANAAPTSAMHIRSTDKKHYITIRHTREHHQTADISYSSTNTDVSVLYLTSNPSEAVLFTIESVPFLRGVNLGSWFVPEGWMDNVYEGSGGGDLCQFVNALGRVEADVRMTNHIHTWISDKDFEFLAQHRINSVRIPIGYWNVVSDPYNMFAPIDPEISLSALDHAFQVASMYGISVLLDMHGGAGSQNGRDHSGCSGDVNWNSPYNRALTLLAIKTVAERYGKHDNFFGIEVLNEPAKSLEADAHSDLLAFYQAAYYEIRKVSPSLRMVMNILYGEYFDLWDQELTESQGFHNVIFDYHLYDCYGDQYLSTQQHIDDAYGWSVVIKNHSAFHPILVGEWSLATGQNPGGQAFIDAQKFSFSNGIGWYFWSLKSSFPSEEWSFEIASSKYKI